MKAEIKRPGASMSSSRPTGERVAAPDSFAGPSSESPFKEARLRDRRLKLFEWGESGTGKTILALQFPAPVVIDLEGGTDLYGDSFEFDVMRASTADQVMEAVDWLLSHDHPYQTLVIDPITVYWDALQKKWSDIFLRRNKGTKGHKFEFYDLQPRDWMTLKAEFKELIRKLIALNMIVVVTARQKIQYADGAFMRAIGETFDGEKSLPYLFDTIVRLYRDEKGRFMGECLKDRSNRLPTGGFECSIGVFKPLFGEGRPLPEPGTVGQITDSQKGQIRELADQRGLSAERLHKGLAPYGANDLDDLTADNADSIIGRLKAACRRNAKDTSVEE